MLLAATGGEPQRAGLRNVRSRWRERHWGNAFRFSTSKVWGTPNEVKKSQLFAGSGSARRADRVARKLAVAAVAAALVAVVLEAGSPSGAAGRSVTLRPSVAITRVDRPVGTTARVWTRVTRWRRRYTVRLYVDGRLNNFARFPFGTFAYGVRPGRHRFRVEVLAGSRRVAVSKGVAVRVRPPAGPAVAAVGDIACDPASPYFNGGGGTPTDCRQRATAAVVARAQPDAVLPLGDLQYECGSLAAFQSSYAPTWGRFLSITHPVIGNHEYQHDDPDPHTPCDPTPGFFAYFGLATPTYYSYEIGSWHVVALNSECEFIGGCDVGSAQEQWLRADLAQHPAQCLLAYWHRPRWDILGDEASGERTSALWRDLVDAGADLALAGHDHVYARYAPLDGLGRRNPKGLRQIIVGTGGRNIDFPHTLRNVQVVGRKFGVLLIELHPGGYRWMFAAEAGVSFSDTGTSACH
jgi:acid phosphatase type 7